MLEEIDDDYVVVDEFLAAVRVDLFLDILEEGVELEVLVGVIFLLALVVEENFVVFLAVLVEEVLERAHADELVIELLDELVEGGGELRLEFLLARGDHLEEFVEEGLDAGGDFVEGVLEELLVLDDGLEVFVYLGEVLVDDFAVLLVVLLDFLEVFFDGDDLVVLVDAFLVHAV